MELDLIWDETLVQFKLESKKIVQSVEEEIVCDFLIMLKLQSEKGDF